MPARAPKGQLEDSYQRLLLNDFAGGLNTYQGAISLPSNTSPDMLNLLPLPGKLKYRGGVTPYADLTATADQAFEFYDSNGAKHFVVWEGGNVVDVVSSTAVAVESTVYTAGVKVGACTLNGVLYWSTATVPLRFWNPVTATKGAVVQTGATAPPASPYLLTYTGAIVALGVKYGTSAYQPTVMGWSVVNEPGNWSAAESQAVGPLRTSASLAFGIVLGIANTGVPPTRTFIVARSDVGLISYTGALGSLQENAINCPVGCLDGASAVFCPGADGFGDVIFLGTDGQFWKTNGINAVVASLQVQQSVQAQVTDALYNSTPYRFWAGYNEEYLYYFCNVNGFQFVYKWDIQQWTVFYGWPNGPILNTTNAQGIPTLYVASNLSSELGFFAIGIIGATDNGSPPNIYYRTAWLHAGDPELLKIWSFISLLATATGTVYQVSARGLSRGNDGSFMQSDPIILATTPINVQYPFILNQSLLDGPDVLTEGGLHGRASSPVMMRGRFACPVVWEQDSMCRGIIEEAEGGGGAIYEDLKAVAIQLTVAYYGGYMDYEVLGFQLRYMERAYRREGGNEYDMEMGVPNSNDPFVYEPLVPDDTAQSS